MSFSKQPIRLSKFLLLGDKDALLIDEEVIPPAKLSYDFFFPKPKSWPSTEKYKQALLVLLLIGLKSKPEPVVPPIDI